MLYILLGEYDDDKAEKMIGKPIRKFADYIWSLQLDFKSLNNSLIYKRAVTEIDNGKIIAPNIIQDIPSGDTYPFQKSSTGVLTLCLIEHDNAGEYSYQSQWLGPNCYQILFDMSKNKDIYIHDDSDMFTFADDSLTGEFIDLRTGELVKVFDGNGFDYCIEKGYK